MEFPINASTGWKRLLLADGPRQVINGLTLYSFYLSQKDNDGSFFDLNKYTNGNLVTAGLIFSTIFTVLIFLGSALLLLAAGICYIPLLCYIRGNLKVCDADVASENQTEKESGILLSQSRQGTY